MAYITGLTEQGCCLPVHFTEPNIYECEPDVGELHRKHRIYNDYHMWYAKIEGKVGEEVIIHLNWPHYDPNLVSQEYLSWASFCPDWPSFFKTVGVKLFS